MSTIEPVENIFGQRIGRIILAPRNRQALDAALQEEQDCSLSTKSPELLGVCEVGTDYNLPLTGDTLITEGIHIFQT